MGHNLYVHEASQPVDDYRVNM